MSRKVKVVNVVFNIINEKIKAATATGCYRIGIFAIEKESYETTKEWLPTIWDKIKLYPQMYFDKIDMRVVSTKLGSLANLAELIVNNPSHTISSVPSHALLNVIQTTSNVATVLPSALSEPPRTVEQNTINLTETNRYSRISINHCFCADYKMVLLAHGMYAATSSWPCIFCTQHKDKLYLPGK